ncbi:MAG: HD domain-containing protein [Dehalococcoidia bacterium]
MTSDVASGGRTGVLGRTLYRARQFFTGFRTILVPSEVRIARELLTPAELVLFAGMEPRDRRHSMNVLLWLRRTADLEGAPAPSKMLEAAALLHDVGKGRMHVVERVAFVILNAVAPGLVERIGQPDGPRWRQGLWRLRHHGRLGAEILTSAGTDPRVIALVRAHTEHTPANDLEDEWLRRADRAC